MSYHLRRAVKKMLKAMHVHQFNKFTDRCPCGWIREWEEQGLTWHSPGIWREAHHHRMVRHKMLDFSRKYAKKIWREQRLTTADGGLQR